MDDVDSLVQWILNLPETNNKLVVLCEGEIPKIEKGKPPSPHSYKQRNRLPDASFYRNCVPRSWQVAQ